METIDVSKPVGDPLIDSATVADLERAVKYLNKQKAGLFLLGWSKDSGKPSVAFRNKAGVMTALFVGKNKNDLYTKLQAFARGLEWHKWTSH